MHWESDREHHVRRARAELDLGYRAMTPAAARAHLELSSLHMACVRALGETDETAPATSLARCSR